MADSILSLENITKVFTSRKVLDGASFYLKQGEKVGVIGINGTGKSTLLKIAAGIVEPDEGKVVKGNNIVINYLPQNPDFPPEADILGAVLGDGSRQNENEAKTMLTKLGIYDFDRKVSSLSGGQRKKLALCSVLISPCDILILDDPTNHLDQEMADWLEDVLKRRKEALIMITHDRYFLDSVTGRIIEVDKGHLYSYDSGYSGYLELKMERIRLLVSGEAKRQNILRKELAWIRRGARARSTKQKAHIQRYEALRDQESPEFDKQIQLESISSRMGKTTVELHGIYKSYDDRKIIDGFTYNFLKTDRVGFVGNNGAGKTTLLKIIAGLIEPDEGQLLIGQTIKIGYYSQDITYETPGTLSYMDPDENVIDYIRNTAEFVSTVDGKISASKMLERFLFDSSMQYTKIAKLSGGEKKRLNLLRVLIEAPNVLLLDEPTNDLDIPTLNILEDYLDAFEGIVVVVSHDRYFLDRVVNRIFAFEGDGIIRQYEGGWTDYHNKLKESGEGQTGIAGGKMSTKSRVDESSRQEEKGGNYHKGPRKLKFTFQEQKDYETIEAEIAVLEEKEADLDRQILKNASDFLKLSELTGEKEKVQEMLLAKMERWEYLEDLAEKIRNQ